MSILSSYAIDIGQQQYQEQKQGQTLKMKVKEELQFSREDHLPQTKIRRQYKCKVQHCDHQTYNPRQHLRHRALVHLQKMKIVECPLCVYACQYRQKLNRHLKLVHHLLPHQLGCTPKIIQYNYDTVQKMDCNEPVDLSYPKELKQLLKNIESTRQLQQALNYNAWTEMITRQNGYSS